MLSPRYPRPPRSSATSSRRPWRTKLSSPRPPRPLNRCPRNGVNPSFSGWGGVFGDQAVAAAMIDRIVHHADVLTLKGASYRLRGRGIDSLPSIRTTTGQTES